MADARAVLAEDACLAGLEVPYADPSVTSSPLSACVLGRRLVIQIAVVLDLMRHVSTKTVGWVVGSRSLSKSESVLLRRHLADLEEKGEP